MAVKDRENIRRLGLALLTSVAVCAVLSPAVVARAQDSQAAGPLTAGIPDDAKLLLAANELIYDRDAERVTAMGAVQINYGGYQMVARKVVYDQKTGRMTATGNIELIEPSGNRMYAETLDVTDNFAEGFVNALRIETTDNTRLAAESAERVNGTDMILHKGVYTACLPCADHPERPPLWQVKAERVIQNGEKHTVRLEKARFELFGRTIAVLPAIEVPDHTIKRKSGFLFPEMRTSQNLGFGLTVPYYFAISNQQDATVKATGFTSQGVLIDAEIRQRFEKGTASVRIAGIDQLHSKSFDAGTSDANRDLRGMIASEGKFEINPRWTFGWDVMFQSDNNFARTYSLDGLDDTTHTNQVYLTGLGKRNSFDMRGYYFDVQDADTENTAEKKQPTVLPSVDYAYYAPEPIAGGQLSGNLNFTALSRFKSDELNVDTNGDGIDDLTRYRGIDGTSSRLTGDLEWKRTLSVPGGLQLTPLFAARGDAYGLDLAPPTGYTGDLTSDATATRYMLTAGLEARYPVLITTNNSSHIIEPIAQIYARNDEQMAGRLPNEDAQSFVFDATNLFERDKFSGYDRVEGGTRANVGVRYVGSFDNGFGLRGIFGQSYQIAGLNSFATDDLVNVGSGSGLETARSDFVGMAGIDMPNGMSVATNVRLDEQTLDLRRTDANLSFSNEKLQTSLTYSQIAARPEYGFTKRNDEIQSASSIKIDEYWSLFGSVTWDIDDSIINRKGIGISYADECTIFSLVYSDKYDPAEESASDWSIGARLTFRTLGDVKVGNAQLAGFN
ncbi:MULTISPECIES: LPS-assembly protein LptD [Alphaproteobacteria]|uniref:LPS-assembly protein LptD n=2 Tax=Alphaproteobacteria TaxID=28211 RepID=A0A512HGG2_9HYPH|nr:MULTISPECIES: LPS-assembly protein LptD [Alphaproteobacteria]GEO84549.1 LPS-assembly protein LptD [Ciceribacter naphthalenivorans]GLR22512.1 LPS-assembly protein LptD [Ciceribacter naphthalenivorans]GLT05368.1 LPS-assembly protein LptD [Sphingomonas psychrolutea]